MPHEDRPGGVGPAAAGLTWTAPVGDLWKPSFTASEIRKLGGRAAVGVNLLCDLRSCLSTLLALRSPCPTGVERVPSWAHASVATLSRIMVAEARDKPIPDRRELGNQERFGKRYPYVVHDEVAREEIRDVEV